MNSGSPFWVVCPCLLSSTATTEEDLSDYQFWGCKTFVAHSILAHSWNPKNCFLALKLKVLFSWVCFILSLQFPWKLSRLWVDLLLLVYPQTSLDILVKPSVCFLAFRPLSPQNVTRSEAISLREKIFPLIRSLPQSWVLTGLLFKGFLFVFPMFWVGSYELCKHCEATNLYFLLLLLLNSQFLPELILSSEILLHASSKNQPHF